MEDLIREGTLDRHLANLLEDYVLARKNILICGGTGTGKSTLLSILGKFIPQDERVLVIEDTAEIQLPQENLVRFEARREQNGLPAVAIRDLLKAALRHRPDRIVLGEVRGSEAFDLLQLLNTGHSGTLSTIHASSAQQGLARFTSCVLQSGVELPFKAIKTNIADSLNVVIHVERRPGRRYISEVLLDQQLRPRCGLVRLRRRVPGQAGSPMSTDSKFAPRSLTGLGICSGAVRACMTMPRSSSAIAPRATRFKPISKAETIAGPHFQNWLSEPECQRL